MTMHQTTAGFTPAFPLEERTALEEGPAVLRLRMLELKFGLRDRRLSEEAREEAEAAMKAIKAAVLARPHNSIADLVAKIQTWEEDRCARPTCARPAQAAA